MKKRILCFGDSNTWGYIPTGGRYDEETRWPMRLQRLLGEDYAVVEEGLNGRTCVFDDPVEGGYKSGAAVLPVCLMSHSPLDVVVIMLGSNDTKMRFNMNAKTIGEGVMQLVKLVRIYGFNADGNPPRVLIVAPAPFLESVERAGHAQCFGPNARQITLDLAREYARIAKLLRCDFLDAAGIAEVSPIDGVHLTKEGHLRLADAVAEKLRGMIG